MKETVAVMATAWLLATAIGWVVTGLVGEDRRAELRPVSALVGLAVAILVLRWTAAVMGVRSGVWVVLGVVVVLGVIATVRDPRWWRASRTAVGWTVLVGAAAAVPALVTFGPTLAAGDSRVVQPSNNNDAYYYVTTADWLVDHPASDVPVVTDTPTDTSTPPSYFPARSQLVAHLRIGQELIEAAVDVAIDHPAVDTWYPLTSLWILLLPTAGYGVAIALRMRRLAGVGMGLATSVSAVTILQLANQNTDALFGICLMPFAVAAVVSSLGTRGTVPRWLAALLFAAAVGSYTEYLPVVAPALLVGWLVRRPRALLAASKRLLLLVVVAAVAGPFVWYDAVRSLIYLSGVASGGSSFDDVGSGAVLNRFLGTTVVNAAFTSQLLTPVLVTVLAIGVVGALAFSARRWFLLVLVAWPPFLAYYLVELAARPAPYTQQRVIGLFVPLLMLVAAFGWNRLVDVAAATVRARPDRVQRGLRTVTAGVGVFGLLAWGLVNARTDHRQGLPAQAERRHVDPSFAEAAGWVDELGGPDGRDVDVLVSDFFTQLWTTDALRTEPDVQYPRLFPSYQGVQSYWSGAVRRYLLVDTSTTIAATPGMIVRSNARFELIDLDKGSLALLSPGDEFAIGNWFLLTDSDTPTTVTLRGATRPNSTKPVRRPHVTNGVVLAPDTLTATTTQLRFPLPARGGTVVNLRQGAFEFIPSQISTDGAQS